MRLSSLSALAVLAAVPAFAQSAPSPDATLWASASKGAAGDLQHYLRQYPTGHFASQAKAALAALSGSPSAPVPAHSAASAVATAPKPPVNLTPGWLVETRAMQAPENSSDPTTPWIPSPVALAISPRLGPSFDIKNITASQPGAGPLPAIAGSAQMVVNQAGQWGLGAEVKWTKTGPCTVTLSVQGNQILNATTQQANYFAGSGDTTFSAAASLAPGKYDVAWTLVCQRAEGSISPDATLTLLVAPPGGVLSKPANGVFMHPPHS